MIKKLGLFLVAFLVMFSFRADAPPGNVRVNRARYIKVQDSGAYYTGTNVEAVLQEIGATGGAGFTDIDTDYGAETVTSAWALEDVTGKQKRNSVAVDDDSCTGEQGTWWYDTTDSQFEFCNANAGNPVALPSVAGDITDVFDCTSGDCNSITVESGESIEVAASGSVHSTEGVITVNNDSGAILYACTAVYIAGYDAPSGLAKVAIADSDDAAKMPAVGLIEDDIAVGADGHVVVIGTEGDWDTDTGEGWSANDALYVNDSGTSASGDCGNTLTNVRPANTDDNVQKIGNVVRAHATLGQITLSGAGRANDVPNLENAKFWVGNGSNLATPVAMSSEATMSNTGAVTLADSVAVTSWNLTTPTITNGAQFADANITPDAAGELVYDNTVTGLEDGGFQWYDDDEVRQIVDIDGSEGAYASGDDTHVVTYNWNAGNGYFDLQAGGGAGATAWDDIADPDAAGSISFDDTETVTFSFAQNTAGSAVTILNTQADVTNDVYMLSLEQTDNGDPNALFLRCLDDAGAGRDVVFSVGYDGDVHTEADFDGRVFYALTGFDLGTGDYVGIGSASERFVFYDSGSINARGANFRIGLSGIDADAWDFQIISDADADGGVNTPETFQIKLTANVDPTAAVWAFTNTQSAGYSFDDNVTSTGIISAAGATLTDDLILDDGNGDAPTVDGAMNYDRTAEKILIGDGTNTRAIYTDGGIVFIIDGGGSAITTGAKAWLPMLKSGTLTGWDLTVDTSATITIDIWDDTYANFPPTDADAMPGGGKEPTISAGIKATDADISDWADVVVTKGEYVRMNIDANDNATFAVLFLKARWE